MVSHNDTRFGEILAVRTRLVPKRLARWLLEKYDLWDTSFNLPNGQLLIYEEDVHVTLGLPIGLVDISEGKSSESDVEFLEQWRKRWNIERGGSPLEVWMASFYNMVLMVVNS